MDSSASYNILIITVSDRLYQIQNHHSTKETIENDLEGNSSNHEVKGENSSKIEMDALKLDKTGFQIAELISLSNFSTSIIKRVIVSDDLELLQKTLLDHSDNHKMDLIITAGGTGFGIRDSTPEAIRKVIEKEASGLTIAMMTASLQKTPLAALSRPICGVRGRTLIISLPGSSKGALENLESIISVLPHALSLVKGTENAGEAFHTLINGPHPATSATRPIIHTCTHKSKTHHHHHQGHQSDSLKSNDPNKAVTKRARESPYEMIPFAQALSIVLHQSQPIIEEEKSIYDPSIVGCVLSRDIISTEPVPSYRASMVDGYAVVHTDGIGVYPVKTNSSVAGKLIHLADQYLEPGNIMRITTGAPIPQGSTAVVMVEDTLLKETDQNGKVEKLVEVLVPMSENENIRPIGCDISLGQLVFSKGQRISATGGEIATLASIGCHKIKVFKKPVVAVVSTGNELVESSSNDRLLYGLIRDANRPGLIQAIQASGYPVLDLGIARDSLDLLENVLKEGLAKADVIVTTGGVSMGEFDLLKPVIERKLGGKIHFGRVALKPGKPTTFATVPDLLNPTRSKVIFALPGNPVSALVTFQLFVLPFLKKQSGYPDCLPMRIQVKISHDIPLDPRPEFYRVSLKNSGESHWIATGTGIQLSSRVLSMASADGLLVLPPRSKDSSRLIAGSLVDCFLIN